jgi:hypothetical protein
MVMIQNGKLACRTCREVGCLGSQRKEGLKEIIISNFGDSAEKRRHQAFPGYWKKE